MGDHRKPERGISVIRYARATALKWLNAAECSEAQSQREVTEAVWVAQRVGVPEARRRCQEGFPHQ